MEEKRLWIVFVPGDSHYILISYYSIVQKDYFSYSGKMDSVIIGKSMVQQGEQVVI